MARVSAESDGRSGALEVTVVIPHYNGKDILFRCLRSLERDGCEAKRSVLVIDNASEDGSGEEASLAFAWVDVERLPENLGFAGGCNAGIRRAETPYVVLLNNDAEVTQGWLDALVATARADPQAGAVQPKILSLVDRTRFDYAGAAGGMIDIFGFPFTRGRLFSTIETDSGQYDSPAQLFWASGTCTLLRKDAAAAAGLLDADFFAHMEEIDLDWRMQILGYRILYAPDSVVHHHAGSTLHQESPFKLYLNHRNSLVMLLKNYSLRWLVLVLPVRLLLQAAAVLHAAARMEWRQAWAIARAVFDAARRVPGIRKKRRAVQRLRVRTDAEVAEQMYRRSVVVDYFLLGRKTFGSLSGATQRQNRSR